MTPAQYTALDTFNKIATSVLASLFVLFVLNKAVDLIYPTGAAPVREAAVAASSPTPSAAPAPAASQPEAPAAAPAPAAQAEDNSLPLDTLLAAANVQAGQASAKVCGTCHNFAKGAGPKVGPDLYGVVGREVAKEPGFSYSSALQAKGGKWTFERINAWIADPKDFAPGNKMAFAGVKSASQRANIIAYLDSLSDAPVPLSKK